MLRVLARIAWARPGEAPTPTWDELRATAAAGCIDAPESWEYRVTHDDVEVVRHVETPELTSALGVKKYQVILGGWRDGVRELLVQLPNRHPYLPIIRAWQENHSKSAQPLMTQAT